MTIINHFISGAETAGRGTGTKFVYNPATGAVTAELRLANREDLDTNRGHRQEGSRHLGRHFPGQAHRGAVQIP
jgi:malonate-semialdehyde dehydrogenase (acetylating)/methylmalonate-semialdehyde dehydrogenase